MPRDELLVDFQQAYHGKLKWQAERGEEDLLTQLKSILNETDPTTSRILGWSAKRSSGEKSKFDQWQNDIADLALSSYGWTKERDLKLSRLQIRR